MRDQDPEDDGTPDGIEAILRALAESDRDDGPAPTDERLRAYRLGRLPAGEARELERLLARSAAGRRRLLELAGLDSSLPLRRVRRAVLGQAAGAGRPRRLRASAAAVAAVAAVAAMVMFALLVLYPQARPLPPGLAFDVAGQGLAEVRSAEAVPGAVRAYPGTALRISLRPRGESPAGLAFALFRRQGDALRRVREPEEVRLAAERGSAAFSGTAGAVLATRTPGVYPLFAVVSSRRDLPARVALAPGQDGAAALRSSGRLVYPLTVTLLAAEPPVEEREP
jgi:hypothetical protein